MRFIVDRLVKFIARQALRVFFRRIEVEGADRVAAGLAVVYVANHSNSLVDPLLVLGFLPRYPRFVATSMLWRNRVLRPFLALGRVIPVYRRQDPGYSPEKNEETFARCRDVLVSGGAVALFPEGLSHDESQLQPLKTGAGRIVLGAGRAQPGLGIRIIPVGLTFESKHEFRSRALIKVGEPIDPTQVVERIDPDDRESVLRLTERIRDGLDDVTLSYPSWDEARIINRAVELYARGQAEAPTRPDLATDFPLRKTFARAYRELKAADPDRVASVAQSVATYDRMLSITELRHEHVISKYPHMVVATFVLRTMALLLVRMPLALVGTVLNAVPFALAKFVGSFDLGRMDVRAGRAIFAGFLAFPAAWGLEALWAGLEWGIRWGWLMLIAGPLSGAFTLKFFEDRERFVEEARAYLVLRTHERMKAELGIRREAVAREVTKLAALYVSSRPKERQTP